LQTINCKGTLIDFSTPKVMGIINVTPDSFFDGGRLSSENKILQQAEDMLSEGATFLDIGGYSSRPDATDISENEEAQRVVPAIKAILKEFPSAILSIDTFRSNVAKRAVTAGAAIINDISAGLLDDAMLQTVANLQVPYILMHMRGRPQTMKSHTEYDHLTTDIITYFTERIAETKKLGINDCMIDPGFGFAKNREQNFELLQNLDQFSVIEVPLLAGISRKSMIYKTLNITPDEALNGTSALHMVALQNGASILRVHDVAEAVQCIKLNEQLKK
jgi:dihydropteroate synthase